MKTLLCLRVAMVIAGCLPVAEGSTPPKKVIITGWDSPDTAQFRARLQSMEKWPFEGTVVYARGRQMDGQDFDSRRVFVANHWERSCFSAALADLKGARSAKLTDNFLLCGANPGDVDWFDDSAWREIADHFRTLAWLAHEGGFKGLAFDPEAYTPPHKQLEYGSQARAAQHPFEDYARKARERGREAMRAIISEFPDVVLFNYFLLSYCADAVRAEGPQLQELAGAEYGLVPAFADGWLDALPPTATIVDGNERAYRYNSPAAFNAAFVQLKNACQALVSPENRSKHRAQVQVSHGIFLDAYVNPPGSPWHIDGLGGPRIRRLEQNVFSAIGAADEYVWLYGQKGRWWPPLPAGTGWPEVLPGIVLAVTSAKDPIGGARLKLGRLRASGALANLLVNANLAAVNNGQPKAWTSWQQEGSKGRFSVDANADGAGSNAACLRGVRHGCFLQSVRVLPGQQLLVSAKVRQIGAGSAWLMVRWKRDDGNWTAGDCEARFGPPSSGRPPAWGEIVGGVAVPEGASRLVLMLGCSGQRSAEDRICFMDVLVARWS